MNRIIIQLSPPLLDELDAAVKEAGVSRAAFIRELLLDALGERKRRRELQQVVDSYTALPQQDDEVWPESARVWPEY